MNQDYFFPNEILVRIFSYLDTLDLRSCYWSCSYLRQVISLFRELDPFRLDLHNSIRVDREIDLVQQDNNEKNDFWFVYATGINPKTKDILVVFQKKSKIKVYNLDGKHIRTMTDFKYPCAMDITASRIYVACVGNSKIHILDLDSKRIGTIRVSSENTPYRINAFKRGDNILIVNSKMMATTLTQSGEIIGTFKLGDNLIFMPSLDINSFNEIIVTYLGKEQVDIFNEGGQKIKTFSFRDYLPDRVLVDRNDNIIILAQTQKLLLCDPTGTLVQTSELTGVTSICTLDGKIFITSMGSKVTILSTLSKPSCYPSQSFIKQLPLL